MPVCLCAPFYCVPRGRPWLLRGRRCRRPHELLPAPRPPAFWMRSPGAARSPRVKFPPSALWHTAVGGLTDSPPSPGRARGAACRQDREAAWRFACGFCRRLSCRGRSARAPPVRRPDAAGRSGFTARACFAPAGRGPAGAGLRVFGGRRPAGYPPLRHRAVPKGEENGAAHDFSRAEDGRADEHAERAGPEGVRAAGCVEAPSGELGSGHADHGCLADRQTHTT